MAQRNTEDFQTEGLPYTDIPTEENRRIEKRIPFKGMCLKVRKRGISRLRQYEECHSINLSNNGLAFISNSLELSKSEKIDFILALQNQTIQGSALVRHIKQFENHIQYGLMFIQTVPDLNTVLGAENLTTQEIKQLAASMAEHLAISVQEKRDGTLRLNRRRQRLCDALHAYFERLSELGFRLPDSNCGGDRWVHAHCAVKIDDSNGSIEFLHYAPSLDAFQPESISISGTAPDDPVEYQTSTGETFRTLLETLNHISDEIGLVTKLAPLYHEEDKSQMESDPL